ncbi:MAG: fluoride efflux transporter CrcB [Lachnospiraceae bacterium]|nr:fluoride efflux transporter CrcB [Lachnospiraceae bacterium]
MMNILAVGCGGFLGAVGRYLLGLIPVSETFVFPIKTLAINLIGCVAIGLIAVFASKHSDWNPQLVLFLKVGVCGGFTTFSSFALESADLMRGNHTLFAFIYVCLSVVIGVGTIFFIENLNSV